jgi:enoyl-CoA hydratase/carnithine racemase
MAITVEEQGTTAIITLDRPEVLNAMDSAAYAAINEALVELDRDPHLRVGIITGSGGRAFSAGADLKLMHGEDAEHEGWGPWRADRWDFGMGCSKPLIAAIDGYALAGGLELALACDIRLATHGSQFGAPEVKWNLLHGLGALRLPDAVGSSNAMWMLLTGDFIDADEALRIGLVSRLYEPAELMPAALAMAQRIAGNAEAAVRMTKELALRGRDATFEQGMRLYKSYFALLEQSAEQLEGTRAFAEKREPGYRRNGQT